MEETFFDEILKTRRLAQLRAQGIEVREFHYGGKPTAAKPKPNRWLLRYDLTRGVPRAR